MFSKVLSIRSLVATSIWPSIFILTACGGGGSGSTSSPTPPTPPANVAPSVADLDLETGSGVVLSVSLNGSDTDGTIASCSVQTQPAEGLLTENNGSLEFTNDGFVGTTSFTYSCQDNDGAISNIGTVTITVTAPPSGFFIDSAVEGLGYVSGDISGTTDSQGRFEYGATNTVEFFVGDLKIGEAQGKSFVTPEDLGLNAGNTDASGNIAQFLQSLDDDRDASNGITIAAGVVSAFSQGPISIDFDKPKAEFEMASDVSNALLLLAEPITLLEREKTDQHLAGTIAVIRDEPITSNLLASTYFGGRNLDGFINAVLTSPEGNEFSYISGSTNIFEDNPSDLPIPNADTYNSGDKFFAALNADLTTLEGSLISSNLQLRAVYSSGVVFSGGGINSEALILYDKALTEEVNRIESVCDSFVPTNAEGTSSAFPALIKSEDNKLLVLCQFFTGDDGMTSRFGISVINSDFEETSSATLDGVEDEGFVVSEGIDLLTSTDGDYILLGSGFLSDEQEPDDLTSEQRHFVINYSSNGQLIQSAIFGSNNPEARSGVVGVKELSTGDIAIAGTLFFGDSSQNNSNADFGFPVPSEGAIKTNYDGIRDGFIAIYDGELENIKNFTFVGGDDFVDGINAFDIDTSDNFHVAGFTLSNDIPLTENAIQTAVGSNSSYIMRISPDLTNLQYSTYFGDFQSRIQSVTVAADGSLFVAGPTTDSNLPITEGPSFDNVLDEPFNPSVFNEDIFISRIWPYDITP